MLIGLINSKITQKYPHLTVQQRDFITEFCIACLHQYGQAIEGLPVQNTKLLIGDAKAGSGKSTVAIAAWYIFEQVRKELKLPNLGIAFTMFNRLPAQEFRDKAVKEGIPSSIADKAVKTYHAFARQAVIAQTERLPKASYKEWNPGSRSMEWRKGSPALAKLSKSRDYFSSIKFALELQPYVFEEDIVEKYQHLGLSTGIPEAKQIKQVAGVVSRFCTSDAESLELGMVPEFFHFEEMDRPIEDQYRRHIHHNAKKIWGMLVDWNNTQFPTTFEAFLKSWYLDCLQPGTTQVIPGTKVLVIDEAQDADPVLSAIARIALSLGYVVVLIGDPYQSIYSFRGAVDSIAAFIKYAETKSIPYKILPLSQSFRFGQPIANIGAMAIGLSEKDRNQSILGFEKVTSQVFPSGLPEGKHAVLCRTNAGIMAGMMQSLADGKTPFLYIPGDLKQAKEKLQTDIIEMMEAVVDLYMQVPAGSRRTHPAVEFYNWPALKNNQEIAPNPDLARAISLVEKTPIPTLEQSLQKLRDLVKRVTSFDQVDVRFCTAHSTKGLQFPKVVIGDDFREFFTKDTKTGEETFSVDPQERNLLYVALTRAENELYLSPVVTRALEHIYGKNWLQMVNSTMPANSGKLEEGVENRLADHCRSIRQSLSAFSGSLQSVSKDSTQQIAENKGIEWAVLRTDSSGSFNTVTADNKSEEGSLDREEKSLPDLREKKFLEAPVAVHKEIEQMPVKLKKETPMRDLGNIQLDVPVSNLRSFLHEGTQRISLESFTSDGSKLKKDEIGGIAEVGRFVEKYSQTQADILQLEQDTLLFLGTNKTDAGEIILGSSPFVGNYDHAMKAFETFHSLSRQFDVLAPQIEELETDYRLYFKRKRVGLAYELLSTCKEVMAELKKKVYSARSPLRKAASSSSAPKRKKSSGIQMTESIFAEKAFTGKTSTLHKMPISELVDMFARGLALGYTDEDAKDGLEADNIIFLPDDQRGIVYFKPGKTGEFVDKGRAISLIDNMAKNECSKGLIILTEMAPGAFSLIEGQQRISTFYYFFIDQLSTEKEINGKKTKLYFSQLTPIDQEFLKALEFNVEMTWFTDSTLFPEKRRISGETFLNINNGVHLTPEEKYGPRLEGPARYFIHNLLRTPEVVAVLAPNISDERAKLRGFIIRIIVMAFNRKGISNDLSAKIAETVNPITDWETLSDHIRFSVKLCGECRAYMGSNGKFSSAITETFISSFLFCLERGLLTQKDIEANIYEIQSAHMALIATSEYRGYTKEGVNNQGNIELIQPDGTLKGRYPRFAESILHDVLGVELEDLYNN